MRSWAFRTPLSSVGMIISLPFLSHLATKGFLPHLAKRVVPSETKTRPSKELFFRNAPTAFLSCKAIFTQDLPFYFLEYSTQPVIDYNERVEGSPCSWVFTNRLCNRKSTSIKRKIEATVARVNSIKYCSVKKADSRNN